MDEAPALVRLTRDQKRVLKYAAQRSPVRAFQVSVDLNISPFWTLNHLEALERLRWLTCVDKSGGAYDWQFVFNRPEPEPAEI